MLQLISAEKKMLPGRVLQLMNVKAGAQWLHVSDAMWYFSSIPELYSINASRFSLTGTDGISETAKDKGKCP